MNQPLASPVVALGLTFCACVSLTAGEASLSPGQDRVTALERLQEVPADLQFENRLEHLYSDLPTHRIVPADWIKEFLDRQLSGLTGHPDHRNQHLVLVPMGSTLLRMSVFAVGDQQ